MRRVIMCPYCEEKNIYGAHKCSRCSKEIVYPSSPCCYFCLVFIVSMLISLYLGVETCLLSVFINFPAIFLIGYALGIFLFPESFENARDLSVKNRK